MEEFNINKNLLLGVATASTQIEGIADNNNWYRFSTEKGNVKDSSSPLNANQHYMLYKDDIKLMSDMHLEIYRMGIEWSLIEPHKGEFDEEVIKHYLDELECLKNANIKVLVTLHHFSNPLWFEDMGAFLVKDNIKYFIEFVDYVVKRFKGIVSEYITINEINIYATNCYLFGVWVPKHKNLHEACEVMRNLSIAHIEAYKKIKEIDSSVRVGFANHMIDWVPARKWSIFDRVGAYVYNKCFQKSVNDACAFGKFKAPIRNKRMKGKYYDFFGMNYYCRNHIKRSKMVDLPNIERNDLNWEISPESLTKLCKYFYERYKSDIYITENGTCDSKDSFRSKFIYNHLKAISDLDYVKRYYHWTFMDNFEWAEGESAKFGLVECDFKTQERRIRPSGYFYTEIIDNKKITKEMIDKYIK